MGAQQTYEWAVRYSDMVKRAAPITGTARNTIHDFLFTETLIEAITSDSGFNKGFQASSAEVREGLLRRSKIWAVIHKHRNLLAHAPQRLRDEISADDNDMIYAASPGEIEQRRRAFLHK